MPTLKLSRRIHLSIGTAAFVLLAAGYTLRAQQATPAFEAVEGEVWQQLAPIGRGVDAYEHVVSFDPAFSDPTGEIWPCTIEGGQLVCYPSGTVGTGQAVQPTPLQLQGRFVRCDGASPAHLCYASGRLNVGPGVPLTP